MPNKGWSGERFWIEVIEKGLYPPKAITFPEGVNEIIQGEDFSGKRVLDYGCGIGQVGRILKEKGADVTGIDISDKLLEVAKRHIHAEKADGRNLPFGDSSFDYVAAFMVLHVIGDLGKSLSEISRVLTPGGKLFFGIVNPYSEKWDARTGRACQDNSAYSQIEDRIWVFNLIDGRRFDEHYTHRPLEHYMAQFSRYFSMLRLMEHHLPPEFLKDGKYARKEFLFGKAMNR